jgi:hypothetical protein
MVDSVRVDVVVPVDVDVVVSVPVLPPAFVCFVEPEAVAACVDTVLGDVVDTTGPVCFCVVMLAVDVDVVGSVAITVSVDVCFGVVNVGGVIVEVVD